MTVVCVIQARYGSTRLRGKILKGLSFTGDPKPEQSPQLMHVVERCQAACTVDKVIVATTTEVADDATEKFCQEYNHPVYRGSEDDVLKRVIEVATQYNSKIVVRVTGDCPLVSPEGIDEIVRHLLYNDLDYCRWNLDHISLGLASEAMKFSALEIAGNEANRLDEREHVTLYLYRHPERFKVEIIEDAKCIPHRPDLRLTVDTQEDFDVMAKIYNALYQPGKLIDIYDVVEFLDANPEIKAINQDVQQKKI